MADDANPITDDGTQPTTDDDDSATKKDDVQLVVPDETKQKFPKLVAMILESKSMNNQERNYWLQVLPVMTPEQVSELTDILETEKRKLAEIEKKYGKKSEKVEMTPEMIEKINKEKREERLKRKQEEEKHREEENPDDILAQLGL